MQLKFTLTDILESIDVPQRCTSVQLAYCMVKDMFIFEKVQGDGGTYTELCRSGLANLIRYAILPSNKRRLATDDDIIDRVLSLLYAHDHRNEVVWYSDWFDKPKQP